MADFAVKQVGDRHILQCFLCLQSECVSMSSTTMSIAVMSMGVGEEHYFPSHIFSEVTQELYVFRSGSLLYSLCVLAIGYFQTLHVCSGAERGWWRRSIFLPVCYVQRQGQEGT